MQRLSAVATSPLTDGAGSVSAVLQPEMTSASLEHLGNVPPLRGSRASLLRQNEVADAEGLTPIQNSQQLAEMLRERELVAIPVSWQLHVDPRLQPDRRYCRPWTARFLSDLARAYYARFHSALQVNSAVRTVETQEHLLRVNGNAAAAEGADRSPHLTGAAVDLGKKDLSPAQIAWMRAYLMPLEASGKLDVEEEFQQACFHISVYMTYAPAYGSGSRHSTTLLAMRLQ